MKLLSSLRQAAIVCVWLLPTTALGFYDPFETVEQMKPSDELEQRLWAESALLKNQLRREPVKPYLLELESHVQKVFTDNFKDISSIVRVYVYEEPEFSAVTTANGDILLSSGLLSRIEKEDELVALLARELSHFINRDSARTLTYAKVSSNLKEVFSSSLAVYNVATGLAAVNNMASSVSSLAGSFNGMSSDAILQQLNLTPEKLLQDGGKLLASSLKDRLKKDLQESGKNLAGTAAYNLSLEAMTALVKTSVFGYSNRLEAESDQFALTYIDHRFDGIESFNRLMKRLNDQAKASGIQYLTFYGNDERTDERLSNAFSWIKPVDENFNKIARQLATHAKTISSPTPTTEETAINRWEQTITKAYPHLFELEVRDSAQSRFLAHTDKTPNEPLAWPKDISLLRADAFNKRGKPEDLMASIEILSKHIENNPQDWKASKIVGQSYLKIKDYNAALTYFEKAFEFCSDEKQKIFLQQSRDRTAQLLNKKASH